MVLEQGERLDASRVERADASLREFVWEPLLSMYGYFVQHVFRHVGILGGVGVGGGSLVFGGVLLEPAGAFYRDPAWSHLGIDWQRELAPHYATAAAMLGRAVTPTSGTMDGYLRRTAEAMGAGATFGPTPNAIHFGRPGVEEPDPYFGGEGPPRAGCRLCGRCLTGCPYGAKNSLDRNYLYLAERRGAEIRSGTRVTRIDVDGDGYRLTRVDPRTGAAHAPIRARKVVLAAGVVGTVDLLLRCRDEHRSLSALSDCLGTRVRTNSEAIVGVMHDSAPDDLADGPSISSHFYADEVTHITQNRYGPPFETLRFYSMPLVDGNRPFLRALADPPRAGDASVEVDACVLDARLAQEGDRAHRDAERGEQPLVRSAPLLAAPVPAGSTVLGRGGASTADLPRGGQPRGSRACKRDRR